MEPLRFPNHRVNMVTTRSGKESRRSSMLPIDQKQKLTLEIKSGNHKEELSNKKRNVLHLDINNEINVEGKSKKSRILDKTNNSNIVNNLESIDNNENFSSSSNVITKRIELTEEEKNMNGAPEGEIFDMIVSSDNELIKFENNDVAKDTITNYYDQFIKTDSWIVKYEAIVIVRKVVLHHRDILQDGNCNNDSATSVLWQALEIAIAAVESLRSCTIRNGILCLRAIINNCPEALSNEAIANAIISTLINKTGSGPRFLAELSFEALKCTIANINSLLLIKTLEPFASHRNAEISCNAIILAADSCKNVTSDVINNNEDNDLQHVIKIFSIGINAKRSKAKDASKTSLLLIKKKVNSSDIFSELLKKCLNNNEIMEIERVLTSMENIVTATPNADIRLSCTPSPFLSIDKSNSASIGIASHNSISLKYQCRGASGSKHGVISSGGAIIGSGYLSKACSNAIVKKKSNEVGKIEIWCDDDNKSNNIISNNATSVGNSSKSSTSFREHMQKMKQQKIIKSENDFPIIMVSTSKKTPAQESNNNNKTLVNNKVGTDAVSSSMHRINSNNFLDI